MLCILEYHCLNCFLENIEDVQGKRNDLEEIEELLNNGATPEEIFETSFRYRKYEKMIKADYLARRIKETPLVKDMWNEYHWGRSGSGKTYTYIKLCEKYPDEVYLCNDYANSGTSGGGFDFYSSNPARIVILDEFRGNIPYAQLLSMLDVYSRNQQHCRYQNVYNLWTSVVICSIYPPEKVYSFMVDDTQKSVDSIQQLLRRLKVIVYHYINKEGLEYKNCHPFKRRDASRRLWTLIHNGTIFKSEILDAYVEKQNGSTDSERILYYLIDCINEAYEKKGSALTDKERFDTVDQVICTLAPENKLNLLIYDGDLFYVHTNFYVALFRIQKGDTLFVATKPLTEEKEWERVPMSTPLAYRKRKLVYAAEHSIRMSLSTRNRGTVSIKRRYKSSLGFKRF